MSIPQNETPKEILPQTKEQKIKQFKQLKIDITNTFNQFQHTLQSSLEQHSIQMLSHHNFLNTLYKYNEDKNEIILHSDRKENKNLEYHKTRRAKSEEALINKLVTAVHTQETVNEQIELVFKLFSKFLAKPEEIINKRNPIKNFIDLHKKDLEKIGFKNFNKTLIKDFLPIKLNKMELKLHSIEEIEDPTFIEEVIENKSKYLKMYLKNIKRNHLLRVLKECNEFNTVKHLKINKCDFNIKNEDNKINFTELLPNISKININLCPQSTISTIKFDVISKLKKLYLINLDLTTSSTSQILTALYKNSEILQNLLLLSFANNKITSFSFQQENLICPPFQALLELNLEGNKLCRFSKGNLNFVPNIRTINLINNNFALSETFTQLDKGCKIIEKQSNKQILIQFTKNIFMLNNEQREKYIKYLNTKIDNFDYNLRYISFETLFHLQNKPLYKTIKIGNMLQENLRYINLSLCYLDNEDIFSFLETHPKLVNLSYLNLSFNNLDDSFFKIFITKNLNKSLPSLKKINFSGNEKINCREDIENFINFIKENSNLKKIIMIRTGFDKNFITKYLRIKKKEEQSLSLKEDEEKIVSDIKNFVSLMDLVDRNIKLTFYNMHSGKTMENLREVPEMKYFEFLQIKGSKNKVY